MDALSHFVQMLRPAGSVDLRCRFAGLWQVPHEPAPAGHVPYHVVLEGEALLEHASGRLRIGAGDILLFPRGAAHTLRSVLTGAAPIARTRATRSFNGAVTEVTLPSGEAPIDLLCGNFELGPVGSTLLQGLPETLLIPTAGREDCVWLASLVGMLRAETATSASGSETVIREISTALFTLLLRVLIARGELPGSVIKLLADARLAPAVQAVLSDPAEPWTLERLAACCHLARATFARRFMAAGGLTPMAFVTAVRLQRAAQLLGSTSLSLDTVAERCGYQSPAAFARLFKLALGIGPGRYRRDRQASGPASG